MPYKGTVRGKVIELASDVALPEGAEVEVVVKDQAKKTATPGGYPRGSREAMLKFLDTPPVCTPADVDALQQAIKQGKRPASFVGGDLHHNARRDPIRAQAIASGKTAPGSRSRS